MVRSRRIPCTLSDASTLSLFSVVVASILVSFCPTTTASSLPEMHHPPFCKLDDYNSFSDFVACVGHRRTKRYTNNHNNRYPYREEYGHPCHAYIELNQPERRVTNRIEQTAQNMLCDRVLRRRWYKFSGLAGGIMPEMCVEEFSCGTHSPIWLNGQHPTRHGEVVDREVCASLSGKCCSRRWFIRVANCGDFYTYLLTDTPGCHMAYCAGNEMPCPPGQSSPTGFFPGCSDNFPTLPGQAVLRLSPDESSVKFFCDYEGTIARETVIDVDWFVQGEKSGRKVYGDVPVWTDEMIERRRSILTEGYWMGKLGSSVFCRMRARWRDEQGVQSPPVESEKYFAGIKILHRTLNVSESGGEAKIQLQSTIPISCLPQFEDTCKVTIELAHDSNWQEKQCVSGKMRQVVFGDCHVNFTPSNWKQVHNVSVKAVRDFYDDGNRLMRVAFKPIFSTIANDFWNDYRLPDVEVVAMDSPAHMCSSTGDPHYMTFDGLYYHVYLEGEFVLYKNTRFPLQINTRMEECGKVVSCNCGVAVMAEDDVIVIDRCRRQKKNVAEGKSFPDGWNTIHRHALEQGESFIDGLKLFEHDDGRRYTIQLPTGAYIDFKVGENWVNIFLHGSSDDWKSTLGLCGTFDGDPSNDFLFPDERTYTIPRAHETCGNSSDVCQFAEAWRVPDSKSFFKEAVEVPRQNGRHRPIPKNRYCKCEENSGKSTVVCNYHYDQQNCEQEEEINNAIEKTNDIMFRSFRRRKRSEIYSDQGMDDYFDSSFVYRKEFKGQRLFKVDKSETLCVMTVELSKGARSRTSLQEVQREEGEEVKEPKWPTPSGITEHYARNLCYRTLVQSEIGLTCHRHIYDEINRLMDACIVDIKVTDSFKWLQSSLDTLVSKCVNQIHNDASLWQTSQPAPTVATVNSTTMATTTSTTRSPASLAENILNAVCPSGCSEKGRCIHRKCQCINGFTGVDCSISLFSPPQVTFLSDGALCDLKTRPCKKISIYGSNFRKITPIHCQFREVANSNRLHTTTAVFVTFEEVICPVPEHGVSGPQESQNSHTHQAFLVSIQQDGLHSLEHLLVIFDSKCQNCAISNQTYSCSTKDGTCTVGGRCYLDGEKDPLNCCQVCNSSLSTISFVPVSGLSNLVLTPNTTEYRLTVGHHWQQTMSAVGSCNITYQVINYAGHRGLEYALGDTGVHFSAVSSEERIYPFEVRATDHCQYVTVLRNYSIIFVAGSTTTSDPLCLDALESGTAGGPRNQHLLPLLMVCLCLILVEDNKGRWISFMLSLVSVIRLTFRCCLSADTRPPTVGNTVLNLTAVQGQLMTFQVEVGHPVQGQTLKYYVLKFTDSYVSMTQTGLLKYFAPDHQMQEKMTVIVEDACEKKAFTEVQITTIPCTCQNNGTCIMEPQQPQKQPAPIKCQCPVGYSGEACEQSLP